MAITGIDTIDDKQIIAAGAVSAKSAEMAYNDENGNPITGYLTAVPTGTMNESAFGYDSDNKISSYNGSAFAGGSYQPSGNYIPYTAVDSSFNRFKTNSGLEITTSFGGTLNTNFINSNYISLRYINSNLNINNQSILSTGSLKFQTKSDSAYADIEKIHKWDSASDYIQNNSATINEVNTSYQTNSGTYLTAHQDLSDYQTIAGMTAYQPVGDYLTTADSANFYTTANESGFISEVPAGTMNESAFSYDASDNITAYNGSAFKAGDEFPQSATDAIGYVTATSANIDSTIDNVSVNSGAWGGSALPISAGPGIKFEMVNDTLVASTDGYVWQSASLFHTDTPATQTTYTLSDSCSSYDKLEVDFYDVNNWRTQMDCPIPPNLASSGTRGGYFSVVPASTATGAAIWFKAFNWTAANTTWTCYCSEIAATGGSTTQTVNANETANPPKVINIIGWKRVGGN